MKPTRMDWQYLRKDTFVPGLSLAVTTILFITSLWYHGVQIDLYEGHTTHHQAMSQDYDALVYRRRLLDRYHRRYQALRELGFVAQESRLDWIETVRSIARELDLPNLTYSLEPQLEVVRPVQPASSDTEIQIYLSRLDLELELVHEGDLLRFFDRLQGEAPGLMKVDQCDLERQFDIGQSLKAETNIAVDCSLDIFTVVTSDVDTSVAQVAL